MLVLESQSGLVLGTLFCGWFPYLAERPAAFAVVGMAAFFIAVVRAPVTGILLVTEMPGMIKHDHRRPEMLFGQKPFMFRLQAQAIRDGILKGPAGGIENGDRIGVGKSLERAFSHESEPCDQCFIHKLGKQGQFIRAVYEIGQRGRLANFWFPST